MEIDDTIAAIIIVGLGLSVGLNLFFTVGYTISIFYQKLRQIQRDAHT